MSYTGYLMIDTGGPEPAEVQYLGIYTSNVSRMWRAALKAAGEDIRLADTEGRTAADVIPLLRAAVADMATSPTHYQTMEPSNGWGDYAGALGYLRNVLAACERHPRAYLHWSV